MHPLHIKALIAHMGKIENDICQPSVKRAMQDARKALSHLAKENSRLWDEICSYDSEY